jgi:hypothetical protein
MSDYVYASLLLNVSVYECAYTHTVMFHERYTITYTTDNTKAQSRFSTLSNFRS